MVYFFLKKNHLNRTLKKEILEMTLRPNQLPLHFLMESALHWFNLQGAMNSN